jgi:predicted flap endonuclease-1-like 5' DNA nuclease
MFRIKALNEERAELLKSMKAILNVAETEKRDLTAEENGKFDELNSKAEGKLAEIQRFEKLADIEKAEAERIDKRTENQGRRNRKAHVTG